MRNSSRISTERVKLNECRYDLVPFPINRPYDSESQCPAQHPQTFTHISKLPPKSLLEMIGLVRSIKVCLGGSAAHIPHPGSYDAFE